MDWYFKEICQVKIKIDLYAKQRQINKEIADERINENYIKKQVSDTDISLPKN